MCMKCKEAKAALEKFINEDGPDVLREHEGHHASTAMLILGIRKQLSFGGPIALSTALLDLLADQTMRAIKDGDLTIIEAMTDATTELGKRLLEEMQRDGLISPEDLAARPERLQEQHGQEEDIEVVV